MRKKQFLLILLFIIMVAIVASAYFFLFNNEEEFQESIVESENVINVDVDTSDSIKQYINEQDIFLEEKIIIEDQAIVEVLSNKKVNDIIKLKAEESHQTIYYKIISIDENSVTLETPKFEEVYDQFIYQYEKNYEEVSYDTSHHPQFLSSNNESNVYEIIDKTINLVDIEKENLTTKASLSINGSVTVQHIDIDILFCKSTFIGVCTNPGIGLDVKVDTINNLSVEFNTEIEASFSKSGTIGPINLLTIPLSGPVTIVLEAYISLDGEITVSHRLGYDLEFETNINYNKEAFIFDTGRDITNNDENIVDFFVPTKSLTYSDLTGAFEAYAESGVALNIQVGNLKLDGFRLYIETDLGMGGKLYNEYDFINQEKNGCYSVYTFSESNINFNVTLNELDILGFILREEMDVVSIPIFELHYTTATLDSDCTSNDIAEYCYLNKRPVITNLDVIQGSTDVTINFDITDEEANLETLKIVLEDISGNSEIITREINYTVGYNSVYIDDLVSNTDYNVKIVGVFDAYKTDLNDADENYRTFMENYKDYLSTISENTLGLHDFTTDPLFSSGDVEIKTKYSNSFIQIGNDWYGFGDNMYRQLGIVSSHTIKTPTKLDITDQSIEKLVAGQNHLFLKLDDGKWYGIGDNNNGQLGIETDYYTGMYTLELVEITIPNETIVDIKTSHSSTFAKTSNGKWYVFGKNNVSQLGVYTSDDGIYRAENVYTPEELTIEDKTIKDIYPGHNITFMETTDGTWYTCGGYGWNTPYPTEFEIQGKTIEEVVVGYLSAFIKTTDDTWYVFGNNDFGQLGLEADYYIQLQEFTIENKKIEKVIMKDTETFIKTTDGTWYATGSNYYGQLGLGDTENRYTPTELTIPNETIKMIYVGESFTFISTESGKWYACGSNGNGQLGLGDTENRNVLTEFEFNN